MDEFHKFDNVIGFFVGNEVIAKNNQSLAAPYIKAAARDMKAYRDSKDYRKIPIGYSAADIAELRPALQNYLACGTNTAEAIDFFGLNAYEWCGPNDMATSGYDTLNSYVETYNIPIFFSETGCNTVRPRDFADQTAILGPNMTDLWSGAIVYEWIEEANNYGLISYGPAVSATVVAPDVVGGFTVRGTPTPISPDFPNLQSQWKTLSPKGIASSDYSPTLTPPACPSSTAGGWLVEGDVKLPSLGQALTTGEGGTAIVASTSTPTGTGTGTAASPSETKGSANGGKEVAGMSFALVTVMLGFIMWL
jgi:1,3-beta-glucanosyltransferase GAS1